MILIIIFCRYPLGNVTLSASGWYASIIAVDRASTVKSWRKISRSIKKEHHYLIFAVLLMCVIFHIPRFFEYVPDHHQISKMHEHPELPGGKSSELHNNKQYRTITYFLTSGFTTIIPFLIITFFGSILIFCILKMKRQQENMLSRMILERRQARISRATRLALLNCILFSITGVFSLTLILVTMVDPIFINSSPLFSICSYFNTLLLDLRRSIHLFLYCLSDTQYRIHLRRTLNEFFKCFQPLPGNDTEMNEISNRKAIYSYRNYRKRQTSACTCTKIHWTSNSQIEE